jgi:hypothetical protein
LQFAIKDQAAGVVDGRDRFRIANCKLQIGNPNSQSEIGNRQSEITQA